MMYLGLIATVVLGGTDSLAGLFLASGVFGLAGPGEEEITTSANRIAWLFLILSVVMSLAMFYRIRLFGILSENLTMTIRKDLFASILSKPMGWFDKKENAPGQLSTVLQTDCTTVNGVFGDIIAQWIESVFSLCLGISLGLHFSWQITLVAIVIAPFLAGATYMTIAIEEGRSELID